MYFNVRNILQKSGTFPPGHPVYDTLKHFSIYSGWCYQCTIPPTLLIPFSNYKAMLSNAFNRQNATQSWPLEETGGGGYIATRLDVWPWTLLILMAKAILIGNWVVCMKGPDGHKWILDIRIDFYRANDYCRYSVFLKAAYDHVLPPREAKGSWSIHVPPMASGICSTTIFNARFFVKNNIFETESLKIKLTAIKREF